MTDDFRWIDAPQGRLYAQRWPRPDDGAATPPAPILMLHDSLGCVALWREFPAELARATGRDVIAYDRAGFGRSAPAQAPLPADFIAAEACDSLPALQRGFGFAGFVALGHSVGGAMAAACAAAQPEHCEALVTISAQAFVEARTLEGIRAAREAFARPDQFERLARHHGERARWVLDAWIDTWLDPAFAGWTLDATLARVRCPALVLHGEHDEYGSPRHPARIVEGLAGPARMMLLPGCAHVPHREAKPAVLGALHGFLGTPAR
ncbi:alpha/beta fold hydrolase [Burkholderia gladioli]|uniref:alpha/beta fold hydrolase n=1 Tax=Burkholderia gladioli TaxID=28095 RepID=UPI00163DF237|nr:alpha/beta fold hydrolase [Burkholderia gladioli]